MLSKWKENGQWKTIKVSTITTAIGIILTLVVSQASGMFSWKAQVDTEMAVMKQDCVMIKEKVKSVEEKIDKIYEYIIESGKKNSP